MNEYLTFALLLTIVVTSVISLYAMVRSKIPLRVFTVICLLMVSIASLSVMVTKSLSYPKPIESMMVQLDPSLVDVAEAKLIAHHLDRGKAIYLWYLLPNDRQPKYFSLPWSTENAEKLRKAKKDAESKGDSKPVVGVPFRFEGQAFKVKMMPYAEPPEAPVLKAVPEHRITRVNRNQSATRERTDIQTAPR